MLRRRVCSKSQYRRILEASTSSNLFQLSLEVCYLLSFRELQQLTHLLTHQLDNQAQIETANTSFYINIVQDT